MPDSLATVRPAIAADLDQVTAIYADLVVSTHIIFELHPPSVDFWAARLGGLDTRDCFLVAVDGATTVRGFAYSGPYRPKPAYAGARETTIHLASSARGRGIGRILYGCLLAELAARGNRLAVGIVAEPNDASSRLHEALGFERVGTVPDVGEKFGRLWSTTLWTKHLGSPTQSTAGRS